MRQIGPLVQGRSREQVVSRVLAVVQEEVFRGPIPHPRHLEAYERICPGSADRILGMAEKTLEHNISVSRIEQEDEGADRQLGMKLGFAALMALVASAVVLGALGHANLAAGFIAAGALGTVGRFISGRNNKS